VLLVVLALLVLMTIVAALVYSRAADNTTTTTALKRQLLAQDRAMAGMATAIATVNQNPRPAPIAGLDTATPCPFSDASTCGAPYIVWSQTVNNGNVLPLDPTMGQKAGGYQTVTDYFTWMPGGADAGTTQAIIVVRVTGYHGYVQATAFTSIVMAELGLTTSGGSAQCSGYCGSGL
jgi:hypothetical protein